MKIPLNPPLVKGDFEVPPLKKGPPWRDRSWRMPQSEQPGLGQGLCQEDRGDKNEAILIVEQFVKAYFDVTLPITRILVAKIDHCDYGKYRPKIQGRQLC